MKQKTFLENNKTIKIYLNDYDCVIIEIYDYSTGTERIRVNLDYYFHDFYYIIELYKKDMLLI